MIIDLHTHFVEYSVDFGEHLRSDLARCGIAREAWEYTEEQYLAGTAAADRAIVFGLRALKTGWDVKNARVADFVARNPGKYIFFTAIDPTEPDYMAQLRHDHEVWKCKGVKLGPIYQGIHPHDARYYKIYAYCEEHELPIITHMAATFSSGVPLEFARPIHMDQVACDFPHLKIVMAHLGHPWEGECIAAIRHQPNLYADLSALYYRPWQFYQSMRLVEEYGVSDKVLFGSDFPATTTAASIDGIRRVNRIVEHSGLPPVSSVLLEQIIHSDSLQQLGIK